jgi:hypothetical protein
VTLLRATLTFATNCRFLEVVMCLHYLSIVFAACKEYLGNDFERWRQYDATDCAAKYVGHKMSILIDQGTR